MPNVKIIADSTCDLGDALIQRYDIAIAPLYVTLDEKSYKDGVEITAPELLALCEKTKQTPKTAATSQLDFYELFKPYAEAGRDIVFIGISAEMSAQVQNAVTAAQELPDRTIRCIDSQNLSTGIGLLVIEAAERAQQGMGADQIADEVEALRDKVSASFVLDTLTYLHRGGRCSGVQAIGAAMLNIKPQITVSDGKMAPTDKFRGKINRVIDRYLNKQLENIDRIDPRRVFLTYTSFTEEEIAPFVEAVRARGYFEEIFTTTAGSVISSHCGPNTLGILYLEKS